MPVRALLIAAVLTAAAPLVSGQEAPKPSSRPAFEVVSVRPNKSGPGPVFMRRLPGVGFEAGNVTPRDLFLFAYDIQRPYLVGLPGWAENERFDIVARVSSGGNVEMTMLRGLLEDRFRVVVHSETREMPVYALVLARPDGRLGPQLRRSQVDCVSTSPAPPSASAQPQCPTRNGPGFTAAVGRPIPAFLFFLVGQVQRAVIDRTGLTGTWDLELQFNPDSPDDPRPSLFTALQEQLGLRLEPSTAPVPVLVIDRIERPTEN
jgi:bla regulator protein blaR1